jgi:hypothetical protein
MGKNRYRRQVSMSIRGGGETTISRVSANGGVDTNARAKGCFEKSTAEKKG